MEKSNQIDETALQEFAYAASHDLQEPLRVITSYLELLLKKSGDQLSEKQLKYIQKSLESSAKMKRMIGGLLEFSRISTMGNEFEELKLCDCIKHATESLKKKIESSGAIIKIEDCDTEIKVDREQITRVFKYLISNSIKFKKEDELPIIEISFDDQKDKLICNVIDNGIGIKEQYYDRVFRIFQKLNNQDYQGDGMGLSISRRILERHSADIKVKSDGENFTEFILIFNK